MNASAPVPAPPGVDMGQLVTQTQMQEFVQSYVSTAWIIQCIIPCRPPLRASVQGDPGSKPIPTRWFAESFWLPVLCR